jgi:hypothetical protein
VSGADTASQKTTSLRMYFRMCGCARDLQAARDTDAERPRTYPFRLDLKNPLEREKVADKRAFEISCRTTCPPHPPEPLRFNKGT